MPTVLIFLDELRDKKLNVLKAQLGVKSKREVIDLAIDQYISDKLIGSENYENI